MPGLQVKPPKLENVRTSLGVYLVAPFPTNAREGSYAKCSTRRDYSWSSCAPIGSWIVTHFKVSKKHSLRLFCC